MLSDHFGDQIQIDDYAALPCGQVWILEADTCVGGNATVRREIIAFSFREHEYSNPKLDATLFYHINDMLYDELATLICESSAFDSIKHLLAEHVYRKVDSQIVPYSLTIWAFLKDARAPRGGLSDGLLHFSVNSPDTEHYQVDGIGHGSKSTHFTYVPRAFPAHASADKARLRGTVRELRNGGIEVWIDEAELKAGDSIIGAVASALESSDTVVAFLSKASIDSRWVQKELSVAATPEVLGIRVRVISVLLDDVTLPPFLADNLYIDLRVPEKAHRESGKLLYAADARFWVMRDPLTYEEAVAVGEEHLQWKLPTLLEAGTARTAMIYSERIDFNAPFWTCTWIDDERSYVLEGIKHLEFNAEDRKARLKCVLVPR